MFSKLYARKNVKGNDLLSVAGRARAEREGRSLRKEIQKDRPSPSYTTRRANMTIIIAFN